MMGTTHAIGGAAAWLTVSAATHPAPAVTIVGAALSVGGALAVDIDHRSSYATQAAHGVAVLAGLGGGIALATQAAAHHPMHPLWPALTALGALGLGVVSFLVKPRDGHHFRGVTHSTWGLAAVTVASLAPAAFTTWPVWAGAAVLAGWVSHLALDGMTREGIPLAWPAHIRFGWFPRALSMTTGGKRRAKGRHGWWGHARRSGPEYWLVQPGLTGWAVAALLFTTLTAHH